MKRAIGFLLTLVLCLAAGLALANPVLTFEGFVGTNEYGLSSTEGGRLALQLRDAVSGTVIADLGCVDVEAGSFTIAWPGVLADGSTAPQGDFTLVFCLRNYWQEESEQIPVAVTLGGTVAKAQQPTLAEEEPTLPKEEPTPEPVRQVIQLEALDLSTLNLEDAQLWEEAAPIEEATSFEASDDSEEPAAQEIAAAPVVVSTAYRMDENGVPTATCFWDMQPDAYDLTNPAHQQAIWALMMQPITVLDVGQTEHVYPTFTPGAKKTPYEENTAAELHGSSQGVHVLEEDTDGDGYVLIEAYSNDGTATKNEYMKSIDNRLSQGYVKKSLLYQVQPSTKYALLVDKLRQKLYIFEAGAIIGELDISTGLNNAKQPYNESPAGEFITISRVGEFVSGSMRANYAIRINGGTLLHEVPYRYGGDGKTKIYNEFEGELGKKASHGCIRIQRRKNAQGQNMNWLWSNLELKTKVFIWDDQGRSMKPELPEKTMQLYRNPDGGSNYHLDANCSGVKSQFLPLTGDFTYGDLNGAEFKKLTPCVYCGAPARPETLLERYEAEAKQIGWSVTQDEINAFIGN